MQIRHFVFLVHPGIYIRESPENLEKYNYGYCLAREEECIDLWLKRIKAMGDETFIMQHCNEPFYQEYIEPAAGAKRSCVLVVPYNPDPSYPDTEVGRAAVQHDFHLDVVRCIGDKLEQRHLEYDPLTTTSEVWGGSFEGCAPGYAGAFAHGLGLKTAPQMRFEMCFYDSRFLYGAKVLEVIRISDTDVEAWIFELHDGTCAARYQSRLSEQWLDTRPITVMLQPSRVVACTKTAHTVWPKEPTVRAPEIAEPYTFNTGEGSVWLLGTRMGRSEFIETVAGAEVGTSPRSHENYVMGGDFWNDAYDFSSS